MIKSLSESNMVSNMQVCKVGF